VTKTIMFECRSTGTTHPLGVAITHLRLMAFRNLLVKFYITWPGLECKLVLKMHHTQYQALRTL
jgi:hypothetical protein